MKAGSGGLGSCGTGGRRVGESLLKAHQLGEQAAGCGAKRQTLMTMPEIHPKAVVLRCRPDDRKHVRHAWPDPTPGHRLDRRAEIEQSPSRLLRPFELNRRR